MLTINELLSKYDETTGRIEGAPLKERRLKDLRGCFADSEAFAAAVARSNPLVYSVAAVEPASGEGDLHYALGRLLPGQIGCEYFMTKGHLHQWRSAAEFYFGLSGEGVMLLEDPATGQGRLIELREKRAVYVPGGTAHRTINTGSTPLTYLGVYPAKAGHDYAAVEKNNFRYLVIERNGLPAMILRTDSHR